MLKQRKNFAFEEKSAKNWEFRCVLWQERVDQRLQENLRLVLFTFLRAFKM